MGGDTGEDINVDEIFGAEPEVKASDAEDKEILTLGNAEAEPEPEIIEEAPKLTALQEEAQGMGHTSKEEWVESGKDPERWKTAHEFVSFGHIKQQMDKQKLDFDARIDGVNKIHQAQLDSKIKELEAAKLTAVSEADTEGYNSAQQQIDDLNQPAEKPAVDSGRDPEIVQWEADNAWIDDNTQTVSLQGVEIAKSTIANDLFSKFNISNPNASTTQALAYIDKEMAKITAPPANPRRDTVSATERGVPAVKGAKTLNWGDLDKDELQTWRDIGEVLFGNDKKAFLQSVKDTRVK